MRNAILTLTAGLALFMGGGAMAQQSYPSPESGLSRSPSPSPTTTPYDHKLSPDSTLDRTGPRPSSARPGTSDQRSYPVTSPSPH